MSVTEKIRQMYVNAEISKKITWTYMLCFMALIFFMNLGIWGGVSYAIYHPATSTLEFSMKNIQELLTKLEEDSTQVNPNSIREPLVPGVVLRVMGDDGKIFIDTDPRYLSNEVFEENLVESPSLFAEKKFDTAKINNALVYRSKMDYIHGDEHVTLYFYRTITSMVHVFDQLELFLLFVDVFGLLLAARVGILVSRNILKPISEMTNLAKGIAFGNMEGRIRIPPANDELTELAKTLNGMLDRLQGGIFKQQKFVSDASHELRTPATVIAGYIEILEKYGTEDKELMAESVEAIRSESQNMKNLLENLLFLARSDQDRQKIYKTKFNLATMIDDVVGKMQRVFDTHKIILLKNDSAEIFADKTMILQMLRIFLDNAVKYTPQGGTISLNSEVDGKKICVSISDTGIGIAPENIEKIFERSVRIDSESLVKEVRGSGLGLSIAKLIAEAHDIKIEVQSKLGEGTTFKLHIPLAD